jgi:hypothetical protein
MNVPLILILIRDFGVKKVEPPSKYPKKCPIMCCAPDNNNNLLHFQNQRYIGILCPKERERERA